MDSWSVNLMSGLSKRRQAAMEKLSAAPWRFSPEASLAS
jgi:hypothetical protein